MTFILLSIYLCDFVYQITQKLEDRQEDEKKKAGLRERMRQQMKERLASTSIDQEQPPSPDKDVISPLALRSDTPESGEMSPTRLSSRRDSELTFPKDAFTPSARVCDFAKNDSVYVCDIVYTKGKIDQNTARQSQM